MNTPYGGLWWKYRSLYLGDDTAPVVNPEVAILQQDPIMSELLFMNSGEGKSLACDKDLVPLLHSPQCTNLEIHFSWEEANEVG